RAACDRTRGMAAPNPSLAEELKSLRIDRAPEKRGIPRWLLPALAVLAIAALGLIAWRTLGSRLFAPEVETATVALITPAQGAQLLVATGYVVPQRKANISPRIGGRVAKIFVEDGTVVKAGQVIAVLEDADYRAQLAQAQADRAAGRLLFAFELACSREARHPALALAGAGGARHRRPGADRLEDSGQPPVCSRSGDGDGVADHPGAGGAAAGGHRLRAAAAQREHLAAHRRPGGEDLRRGRHGGEGRAGDRRARGRRLPGAARAGAGRSSSRTPALRLRAGVLPRSAASRAGSCRRWRCSPSPPWG